MTDITELWVTRNDIRNTKVVTKPAPALGEDEVLVEIDKFGLTANNVSYAVAGDQIGYWGFFPVDDEWGIVPVWGYSTVTASNNEGVAVGERLYGYYPFASHAVLKPGRIKPSGFVDVAEHRRALPGLYNQYNRTSAEPEFLNGMEDERCLFFPLFVTSYLLYDYLKDNDFFGAKQVLVGSVSSKTGFGLAHCLHNDETVSARVVGLTSSGNVDFVRALGVCDDIVAYGDETSIDANVPAAYVDMSGDGPLRATLHNHFEENLVVDTMVGATHWEAGRGSGELKGAKPEFFFAPSQIEKREKDWGPGVVFGRALQASAEVANSVKGSVDIEKVSGAETGAGLWRQLVDNEISPRRGLILSLA